MADMIADALRSAAQTLSLIAPSARFEAELLMAHALGVSRSEMLLRHLEAPAPESFAPLLERRAAHEPLAYILGSEEFFGLDLQVTPDVLIPRRDSEVIVEAALAHAPDARKVLDCGTGSGALLLAVLANLRDARGCGVDISPAALAVARGNAVSLGLEGRAQFAAADWSADGWSDALDTPFDLILANPPYVETGAELEPSVSDYEPAAALFAGAEGLDAYRALIPQLPALLAPDGIALVEIGAQQSGAVSALARDAGLRASLHRDNADRPRALRLYREK